MDHHGDGSREGRLEIGFWGRKLSILPDFDFCGRIAKQSQRHGRGEAGGLMRQKLISLLLAAAMALPMAGCVQVSIIGGEDGTTEIFVNGPAAPEREDAGPTDQKPEGADNTSQETVEPGYTGQEEGTLYTEADEDAFPEEDGTYNSAEDVALYLDCYGHLPDNYITKTEARELGWTGGSVEQVAPGCAIGGDRFGNREGILPSAGDRTYYECDIDTIGRSSRGAKRLVFSDDGLIYYTEDHYETFTLLYGEE